MDSNRKILVVDDQEDLRQQVARMLEQRSSSSETSSLLEQIRSRISRHHEATTSRAGVTYKVDTVGQGQDAYEMVKNSFAEHQPYALMFLDMRMPPGWDGLETAQRIRSIDKEIQIVIMTAYADYDQQEISEKIGEPDKLLYIKKPFHPEEIRQLALAMTEKWNMNRREKERLILTNRLMRENSALTRQNFREINDSFNAVLDAFVSFLDARSGILVRRQQGRHEIVAASHPDHGPKLLGKLSSEQKAARRVMTNDKDGSGLFPIAFDNFDGFIYLQGKGLIFSFDQLSPFTDILTETAREVLMNAFLLRAQDARMQMDAVTFASDCIAQRLDKATGRIEAISAELKTGKANGHSQDLWDELGRITGGLQVLSKEIHELTESKPADSQLQPLDFSALLDELVTDYTAMAKRDEIAVEAKVEPGLRIRGDRVALERAIGHLFDNGMESMHLTTGSKRVLSISARVAEGAPPQIHLVISDTGGGIPESVHDRLYEPFVTAERDNANGLGATIAKQVIDAHNGRITHSSETGKGAVFTVVIPAIAD